MKTPDWKVAVAAGAVIGLGLGGFALAGADDDGTQVDPIVNNQYTDGTEVTESDLAEARRERRQERRERRALLEESPPAPAAAPGVNESASVSPVQAAAPVADDSLSASPPPLPPAVTPAPAPAPAPAPPPTPAPPADSWDSPGSADSVSAS